MIQLTQDLWLDADQRCYIVGKRCQTARKGRGLSNMTYHTTIGQAASSALLRALRTGVADGSITTLRQFIQEQERLSAELKTLIAPLDKLAGEEAHR